MFIAGLAVWLFVQYTALMDNMKPISVALENTLRNMQINSADPIARHGFTQVPNFILRNPDITANAKTVYSLLLSYAWHNDCCFPGQERLAEFMATSVATISRAMSELQTIGLIDIDRRGLGLTNFYTINFVIKPKSKR
jgi:hypothetical protein